MPHLPTSVRHGYGLGALSISLANTAILFFLLKFLVDGAGLAPAVAGTVLLVGKVWDAVSDPLVGRWSDKTHSAFGPRRLWIAVGSVPWAVLFLGLWIHYPLSGWAQAVAYGALLVAYNTAYTAVVVPYGALTPVLTRDYDERTRLNAARMGWSMVGGIIAGIALPVIHDATGSWVIGAGVLAALVLPPMGVALWVTRGRDHASTSSVGPSMWGVLRVRPFRRTAVLFLLAWGVVAVLSALVPFYVEHHLGRPGGVDLMFATIQLAALAAIPGISLLAQRLHKHGTYALAIGSWGLVLVGLALVPPGAYWVAIGFAVLAGPGIAAAHVLPWSMLPDVVEADTVQNGHERAGAFYGVMTFIEKIGVAIALWGLGLGLQLAGYVQGAAVQTDTARMAIRVMIGPIPAVVLLVAALIAWRWPPVTREAHRGMVRRIEGR